MNDSGGGTASSPRDRPRVVPLSADGRFWWDGQRWRRVAMRPSAPAVPELPSAAPVRQQPPPATAIPRDRPRWRRPPPQPRPREPRYRRRPLPSPAIRIGRPPVGPDGARPAGAASARPHRVAAAGPRDPRSPRRPPWARRSTRRPLRCRARATGRSRRRRRPPPSRRSGRRSRGAGRPCRPGHPPRHRSFALPQDWQSGSPSARPWCRPGPRTRWHSSSRRRGRLPVSRPRPGRRPPRAGRPPAPAPPREPRSSRHRRPLPSEIKQPPLPRPSRAKPEKRRSTLLRWVLIVLIAVLWCWPPTSTSPTRSRLRVRP